MRDILWEIVHRNAMIIFKPPKMTKFLNTCERDSGTPGIKAKEFFKGYLPEVQSTRSPRDRSMIDRARENQTSLSNTDGPTQADL